MASTHKSLRSSTANKRPTTAIADGQIALNTNSTSPGLFFKDSTGATIIKIGPVHVGTTAPNVSPPSGGSSGNSTGEVWLDTSLTPNGVKIWNGSSWTNATPIGSTTVQGLLELATNAETQAGSDTNRAVTPAGLQSKVSDSTSTTSSTTIASSTAVKAAYDLADAALPKAGGTVTGNLEIGTTGSLTFEGSTADGFETTLAVTDPTADRTITLPDVSGNVVTTGDTGTVTSTMIADGTIVDGDISATAEIAVSKLADGAARQLLQTDAAGTGVEWTSNVDVPGTLDVTGAAVFDSSVSVTGTLTKSGNNVVTVGDTGTVTSAMIANGTIVDADISATAEIAVSKLADGAARQLLQTDAAGTGVEWTNNVDIPGTLDVTGAAVFDSTANIAGNLTVDTNTLFVDATNNGVGIGTASPAGKCVVRVSNNTGAPTAWNSNFLVVSTGDTSTSSGIGFSVDTNDNSASISALTPGTSWLKQYYRANSHTFWYGNAGVTQGMTLDSSGRLLVGTSSTSANTTALFQGYGGVPAGGAHLRLAAGTNSPANGANLGLVLFSDSEHTNCAFVSADRDGGTWSASSKPTRLVFSVTRDGSASPTSAMRITNSGRTVVLGNTNAFDAYSEQGAGTSFELFIGGHSATTTAPGSGTNSFRVFTNGNVQNTNNSYGSLSDAKLKENVVDAGSQWNDLKSLQVRKYNFKEETGQQTHTQIGLVAQEVELVSPGLVTESPDRDAEGNDLGTVTKSVNYSVLYMKAVKALQEAMERIETLEAKVSALEAA